MTILWRKIIVISPCNNITTVRRYYDLAQLSVDMILAFITKFLYNLRSVMIFIQENIAVIWHGNLVNNPIIIVIFEDESKNKRAI